METQRGRSIPVVREFDIQSSWAPETPVKPNVSRPGPIYNSGHGGPELLSQTWGGSEAYLSRYTQQNECQSQTHLPYSGSSLQRGNYYPTTSNNNIWDGRNGEMQRQSLEGYLPDWSSQGRRSVMSYGSSDLASVCYPNLNSWKNNGVAENRTMFEQNFNDSYFNTMSFRDLLSINESLTLRNDGTTTNGMFLPGSVSQSEPSRLNNTTFLDTQGDLRGINQQANGFYSQGLQNDPFSGLFWSTSDKHTSGSSAFAPATPDYWQRLQSNMASESTPAGTSQELNGQHVLQEHDVDATVVNIQDHHDKNVSGPITDPSPDKVSIIEEKGGEEAIDLNDTPQKKQRKRRYQPKVIRENKPKRTPKPKTPKPTESHAKRKYARKSKTDTNTPTIPPEETTEPKPTEPRPTEPKPTESKPTEPPAKSCKRSLNFDLNGLVTEEVSESQENDRQADESMFKASMTAYDLNVTENQELKEYMSLPVKENLDNLQTNINQLIGDNVESLDSLFGKKEGSTRKDSCSAQSPNSSPCGSSSEGAQTRGLKRSLSYTTEPILIDVEIAEITQTEFLDQSFIPEISKKPRTEMTQRSQIQNSPSDINEVQIIASKYYCSNSSLIGKSAETNNHALVMGRSDNKDKLMNSWADLSRLKSKKRTKGGSRVQGLAQLSKTPSAGKGERGTKVDSVSSIDPGNATLNAVLSCTEALPAVTNVAPKTKRRSKKQESVNENLSIVPYGNNPPAREETGSIQAFPWRKKRTTFERLTQLFQQLDINKEKRKISRKQQNRAIVPYQINKQEHNALVLYEKDGSIVPYEGPFNPVGKRRQRARVDLDDETTRVWRLLLENIDNEGINGTDEDKAKWWENERRVFRGRVDSFIARMRLVQGDRRFTPWKGSVLDSVIGVFLTQNVSDHLSSSAFMSMAARFPLKPESPGSTLSEEATSTLFGESEICTIEPEESIAWNEKNSRVIYHFDHCEEKEVVDSRELTEKTSPVSPAECCSETYHKTSSYSRGYNANSPAEDKARDDATSSQQSAISSQNSINSSTQQTVGMINNCSESNSRRQTVTSSSRFNCLDHTASFMGLLKMAEGSYNLNLEAGFHLHDIQGLDMLEVESRSSDTSRKDENSPTTEQSNLSSDIIDQEKSPDNFPRGVQNFSSCYILEGETMMVQSQMQPTKEPEPLDTIAPSTRVETSPTCKSINASLLSQEMANAIQSNKAQERTRNKSKEVKEIHGHNYATGVVSDVANRNTNSDNTGKGDAQKGKKNASDWDRLRRDKAGKGKKKEFDWDSLRRDVQVDGKKPERPANTRDSLDWEAVRHAKASDIADTIKERGMNNVLAGRIKDLLDRLVKDHGSTDMEWLRDIPPDKAKEYLLSFRGLGLKSVECVRLLTLHHMAFPVDTNVGRIAVRLGWVPLQPLPESLQLHLLEMYPILESIQQYLWPRLCKLDQKTLYELHYHMITFGKVFCTKRQPNCNACPLRGECRHFASAFASARFALPGPEDKSIVPANGNPTPHVDSRVGTNLLPSTSWGGHNPNSNFESHGGAIVQGPSYPLSAIDQGSSFPLSLTLGQTVHLERKSINSQCEPIVEVPASPEPEPQNDQALCDIEDTFYDDPNEIPTIDLNMKEFTETLQNFMLQEAGTSSALVALTAEAASIPTPKLKNINRLRTEHHVYELPDTHPLLHGLEKRELDDPCSYLLAIWTPGETADSIDPPARRCCFDNPNTLCNEETCSYCSSQREADSQIVRGTILIPTRTAMRGSFPLNGTYFQVNEVFADHDSSLNPIAVPRSWLWNLPRRTVYFGTSIPTIFKGLGTEDIQHCFWRGYVCVRGFDQKTRAPRPLMARLHFPASRIVKGAKGKPIDE